MARDAARIRLLLGQIEHVWTELPDLRLMQLLLDVVGMDDPYYLEDDALMELLTNWTERRFV